MHSGYARTDGGGGTRVTRMVAASSGTPKDLAGKPYWESVWEGDVVPDPVDPRQRTLRNRLNVGFHEFFQGALSGMDTAAASLIEVGCGQSRWLPYFAREFGFEVAGVDYAGSACATAQAVLDKAAVPGTIVRGDLFDPPPSMVGQFDVAFSFGLVEHFADTAGAVAALSEFVRPSGLVITVIPNMVGLVGDVQRWFNRPVFDKHVPLDADTLGRAHREAGLDVISAGWFYSVNFGVVNLHGLPAGPVSSLKKLATTGLLGVTAVVWVLEGKGLRVPPNRWSSPYAVCVGMKGR